MSLVACQRDARLRALDCVALSWSPVEDGRYAVILDDTVLYPEGGGQPADHGWINGVAVVDVQRGPSGVVHTVLGPGAPGPVRVELDWTRRFDHMQQHSAQHLLTALAADHLDRPTVAFHLGEETCTIDLEGLPLDEAARARLEYLANAEIRQARPLRVREVDAQTYEGLPVRSRGLPEGHTGPIRLVEIEGLDLNTCGGTHVAHTGELQGVALVRVEALKGGSRLHYLAGDRVLRRLAEALQREAALTALLTAPPDTHADGVSRLLANAKANAKASQATQRELAALLGAALAAGPHRTRHLHREGADLGQLQAIADAALAARPDLRLLLTGEGVFLAAAPAERLAVVGPALAATLEGRGGGRGGRFQGRASATHRAAEALHLLEDEG